MSTTDGRRTDTRDRLIRTATGLFRRHGVGGVGVGEVCRRAGVTKGVFTHHFPGGKDELVAEVLAGNAADVRDRIVEATDATTTPDELVRAVFDGYAAAMGTRDHDLGCPVAAAVVDGSARSAATRTATGEAFDSWRDVLATSLADPAAELTVAALEGAILLARAGDDPDALRRVGAALATLVATGDPTGRPRRRPRAAR